MTEQEIRALVFFLGVIFVIWGVGTFDIAWAMIAIGSLAIFGALMGGD